MIDQILNERYQIKQQLGKKTGRKTFLAQDLHTEQLVVVKLLTFNQDFEWEDLKLFEREVETLKNLSHESIPRYLNYFEVDLPKAKGFALVQTYIEAKSLEEQIKTGRRFKEEEVKELAKALLDILTYLHQQYPPIIHRDIKPSNILLKNRSGNSIGQVYLVDFGSIQTLAAREGGTLTIVGTYGYMAPEQFGGRAVPASDLYSLGATLIYVLTGTHPADLPQKDLRIQFENIVAITPSFTAWIKRLTEPSLDRRFTSTAQALNALENSQLATVEYLEITQPTGSKVLLTKNAEELQITIPPQGFNPGLIFMGLFAIAWNSFITVWTGFSLFIPFPMNLFFMVFSLPFWGAGLGMIGGILFTLYGKVFLQINQAEISLKYELFGFKYGNIPSSSRENINKIQLREQSWRKDSDGDRVKINPAIIIWAGKHEYKLELSEPELEWLASELSEWLGLPIAENSP